MVYSYCFQFHLNESSTYNPLKIVRSYGTEGRIGDPKKELPPSPQVFNLIMFKGADIKDLSVLDAAAAPSAPQPLPPVQKPFATQPQLPDPSLLGVGYPGFPPQQMPFHMMPPNMNPYMMQQAMSFGHQPHYWPQPPAVPPYNAFPPAQVSLYEIGAVRRRVEDLIVSQVVQPPVKKTEGTLAPIGSAVAPPQLPLPATVAEPEPVTTTTTPAVTAGAVESLTKTMEKVTVTNPVKQVDQTKITSIMDGASKDKPRPVGSAKEISIEVRTNGHSSFLLNTSDTV